MDSLATQRSSRSDNIDLRELLRPLLRFWWLLATCTLIAGISSGIYTRQQPSVYQSTATLMVGTALYDPNPIGNEIGLASQLASAYADIAKRSSMRSAAQQALGMTWLPEYAVRHIAGTQFLEISVLDTIPERAQIVAQELARQLILKSPGVSTQQGRQQFIEEQLNQLEVGIRDTKAEIERLDLELTRLFSARQIADMRAQIEALQSKLAALQTNYAALLESSSRQATNTLLVVEPASLPDRPLDGGLTRNMVVAAAIGFAMAAAAAYLLDYSDDRFKTEQDVHRWSGIAALGAIPKEGRTAHGTDTLAVLSPHQTAQSDEYAAICLNVRSVIRRTEKRTLLVTSAAADDGQATVAANLCSALAHMGLRVVLIDADLYRPAQHRLFHLPNRVGLTTALTDTAEDLTSLLQPTSEPLLHVITSGPLPGNPAALLASRAMRTLLDRLRDEADLIVLGAPPVAATVDPAILALETDGVLFVLAAGRTTWRDLEHALDVLAKVDAKPIGVVLDGVQGSRGRNKRAYSHVSPQVRHVTTSGHEPARGHSNGQLQPDAEHLTQIPMSSARSRPFRFGWR